MKSLLLVFFVCVLNAQRPLICDDIRLTSIGKPINREILVDFKVSTDLKTNGLKSIDQDRFIWQSPSLSLWWTRFQNRIGRWSIGTSIGDDSSVIAYRDSLAPHPIDMTRREGAWHVRLSDGQWISDKSIHLKCIPMDGGHPIHPDPF